VPRRNDVVQEYGLQNRIFDHCADFDWAGYYRRFWEESFDKLDVVVKQMKETEASDDRKNG
jgi:hypothetical protein